MGLMMGYDVVCKVLCKGWEPNCEKTLTGLPKEMYQFWERQLRPRGYKIKFQVVDWPGGMPGDIGITLKWS